MARRRPLIGKGVQTGNNVSHANNRTRRRLLPTLSPHRLYSETLGESIRLRISTHGLRTVEQRGGQDGFLLDARDTDLTSPLRRLKRRIASARSVAPALEEG